MPTASLNRQDRQERKETYRYHEGNLPREQYSINYTFKFTGMPLVVP
jgi:hypothetical protein